MTSTTALLISLAVLSIGASVSAAPMSVRGVQPQPNGATLAMPRGGALRLQVLMPRIVHVTYSPTGTFPAQRVPVVVGQFAPTPFHLTQSAQSMTLATGLMRAQMDRKTGAVRFLDAAGKALLFDFPDDRTARESRDEFLFGPSLLVCPVTKPGAVTRPVYLPAGTSWTDFWTGQTLRGDRTVTAPAPIDRMPLYVRAGAMLPMGPYLQYVAEKPAGPIELRVYRGASYERGSYATIPIAWNGKAHTLTLGTWAGRFPGMLAKRPFHIVWVQPGRGVGVAPSPTVDRIVAYDGHAVAVRGGT